MPASMALAMFFSWIILINALKVPFYLYYHRTIFLIYVSRLLDPVIWLASSALTLIMLAAGTRVRSRSIWFSVALLWLGIVGGILTAFGATQQVAAIAALATLAGCVFAAIVSFRFVPARMREHFTLVFVLVVVLLLLPAELGSLSYYVLSAFHPGIDVGRSWEMLETQLWYTAAPLIPFLYAAFLFSWIWAPLLAKIPWKSKPVARSNDSGKIASLSESRTWIVVMGCFVVMAAFLGYYPYFRDSAYPLVGTDIYWRNALPAERVVSSTSWLAAAAKERHPLVVLGIAAASKLMGVGVESLLRFTYIGLIAALGLTVLILVFAASRNIALASMSAVMSTISVSTTGGMYTGTVAEWVALIVWGLTLAFLAVSRGRTLRHEFICILGLAIGSVAVLFIHPWTWLAMMVGLIAYCAIVLAVRPKGWLRDVRSVLFVIFFNAAMLALSLFVLLKAQGWRVAEAFSLVQNSLSSKYFGFGSWEILVFFSQIWSQFLNPVLLALSTLGLVVLARRRDRLSWILLAWIVAACATSVSAAPMGYNPLDVNRGETQIFRAMFLTPFHVPAAASLVFVNSLLGRKIGGSRAARVVAGIITGILLLAIVNGTFRALFPLLTDPRNYPNPLAP